MDTPLSFFTNLFNASVAFVSTYTIDVIIVGVLFLALYWCTLRYGKGRGISLILSLYIALLAFTHFPFRSWFQVLGTAERQVLFVEGGSFLCMVVFITYIVSKLVVAEFPLWGFARTFEAALIAGSAAILVLSFWYQLLPLSNLYAFGKPIQALFAPSELFFWWLLAPLVGFLFIGRRY